MCDFCENKKFLPMELRGEGIGTMADNLRLLFGGLHDFESNSGSGIQITDDGGKFFLSYDNSSSEYGDGYAEIHYCPMCGRKLGE